MMRNKDEMLILGLTGGIGCGKTTVLTILKEEYDAYIIEADRLAHELMEPGKTVYQGIVDAFGMEVLMDTDIAISAPAEGNAVTDNGQSTVNRSIDRKKLGDIVFHDKDKLALLNSISHPLVKEEILRRIEKQKDAGKKLFVIEAALLIQDGYRVSVIRCAMSMQTWMSGYPDSANIVALPKNERRRLSIHRSRKLFIWKPATIRLIIPGRLKIRKKT